MKLEYRMMLGIMLMLIMVCIHVLPTYSSGLQSVHIQFQYDFDNRSIKAGGPQLPYSNGLTRATRINLSGNVPIEIWDDDIGIDDIVSIGQTNANGILDAGPFVFAEDPDYYFVVKFQNGYAYIPNGALPYSAGTMGLAEYKSSVTYNVSTPIFSSTVSIPDDGSYRPPNAMANVLNVINETARWYNSNGGDISSLGRQRVQFVSNSSASQGRAALQLGAWRLFIPNTSSVWLGRDYFYIPETIAHEYSHSVFRTLVAWDPPGGDHTTTTEGSVGLAFSEGWAQFIPAAVFSNPEFIKALVMSRKW